MIHWLIRFRSEGGADKVVIEADTEEDARQAFTNLLREEEMFGSLIRIEPTDPMGLSH